MNASAFLTRDMAPTHASPNSVRRAFRIVSPTCEDMTALISAALDGDLPWTTRLRMRIHFLYCACCRRIRDHFELLRRACAEVGEKMDEANLGLDPSAREALRRELRRHS